MRHFYFQAECEQELMSWVMAINSTVASALEQLRGAKYFTKLDLRSAYNLIRVKEGDEWKTTFSISTSHYEYLVLPYGLAMAPSIFQAYINEVLREYFGRSVIAYIDDILIYFSSWNQHVLDVRAVLQTLLRNHLYYKAEKCEFHRREVDFLGYIIQEGSVHMQPGKVEAQVRWTPEVEKSFEGLKVAFTIAPVLQQPDLERPFVVEVDTLDTGVRIMLSQHLGLRRGTPGQTRCPDNTTQKPYQRVRSLFFPPLEWDLDQQIKAVNLYPQCPAEHLYVPSKYQGVLITWAHTSVGMGHPGATCTAQLIGTHYWRPATHKDVVKYVSSCMDCTCSKSSRVSPIGNLLPLPIPLRPWSHLAVDFITDLLTSEVNMVVLTVVDRFSKMVQFIPLAAVPTTLEMADLLFCPVFCQLGLPEDIVSERGPQFTS
ncbi:hypothetical protein P4O66_016386 [Electrophorus voltai]|uniref:Gypsy retrotransposon integrase-like protein 1 n=1 Tax=Electrophorus voltai TaxID=2609070 RepID=A0AAD9DMB4_9TELE|nr:hypothetical protein P4O66_016386 [Electrophorus voltai]